MIINDFSSFSWFHWSCLGITADPTEDSWFCAACINKQQQIEMKFKKKRKSDDPETPTHSNSVGRPSKASLLEIKESNSKHQETVHKSTEHKKLHKKDSTKIRSSIKKADGESTAKKEKPVNTSNQVWYCPTCSLSDDGSPMIGCDKCDKYVLPLKF